MNFLKKNLRKLTLGVYVFMMSVSMVYADAETCEPGKICNPIAATSINGFIHDFLVGALKIGLPIVALAIIYSGFLFVAARGNPEKIGKAKDTLMYTLIGAAILLGSWAIAQMISSTVLGLSS